MDIKKEIMDAMAWFMDQEVSLSSIMMFQQKLIEIADAIPEYVEFADSGYKHLLSTVDSLGNDERLSYSKPEIETALNMVVQSFHRQPCRHCNGTGRVQVPGPTGKSDYIEEPCVCLRRRS